MQGTAFKEKDLTSALVRIVKSSVATDGAISVSYIERTINQAGITRSPGISVYHMVEARALVLYAFNLDRYDTELKTALIYFIADYPVFRWSELRYFFSDPEKEIERVLHELKYTSRELEVDGEPEYVWSPRWLRTRTILKRLACRNRAGNSSFFEFLNYTPGRHAHDI
ncbi:hypothetical protein SG34_007020 [Thalassomonas viridans]|uniref:Uncharacterized protein n=1 Tax=Thalassomonas viridans TaxID=137584 RepID=A0AAE9Z4K6_9GAMM|nr:hypothetical protein [Thalassomonas viridans]WDE06651.1 hypothetical protein SG34_007020 [Thalassomonas viridans]